MSLADQLLEKTKQQKLRTASAFAPNFKKPNIGGTPKNNSTSSNSSNNNTSGLQTETNNESSAIGSGSVLSVPPLLSMSFNPTQDNPMDQSILSTSTSSTLVTQQDSNNNTSVVGAATTSDDPSSLSGSSIIGGGDNISSNDKTKSKRKTTSSREKKRRRKTIDSDEDDDYVEPEEDATSTTSSMTVTSTKSATSSKTKRLKKPTGEFKTISDFIRDAILNDYESENTNLNNNNNNNMNNNSGAQQNGISADEFINEEDEFEIENDDQYRDRVHQIEMEEDENNNNNNSDNISAVSGRSSSYKNFVEVKAPTKVIPPNPYKPSDNNSEFDDDEHDDLDSEFGDLEKPAGGPSVFSFDSDGNILMKQTETEEALIPFIESGRQEFNYSRAMRLANLDANKPVNQATYARKGKGERWTKDDLELFYDGLRQFGTDFSMISRLFPKRTRREIHQKYKSEEKKNKKKIEFALKNRAPIDMTLFQKKSKEKDKIQGITRKKVTKPTEGASSETNEDDWKEVTSSSKTTSNYEQTIEDNEFEEDEFDIDDYDPEEDEKKYERPTISSKPQSSTASSSINQDEFEEVEVNEEDETFDNFGNNVLGRGEDEFE